MSIARYVPGLRRRRTRSISHARATSKPVPVPASIGTISSTGTPPDVRHHHHGRDLEPRCEAAAADRAASKTVAWSYSSCRFHHPYGGVCG